MRKQSVTICTGGGGACLTRKVSSLCHAELVSASVPCRELPVTLDRSRNKFGMTPPVKAASCFGWSLKSHVQPLWMALSAFTMAEILLSLTIIGVVAAITLPSLTGNINERTWNTQRKALYARFSQAMPLMDALNGYGTFKEAASASGDTPAQEAIDTCAETFITAGLAKVLKINNICDNEHLEDCGITSTINTITGSKIPTPTTFEELNSSMVGSGNTAWNRYKTGKV